MGRSLGQLSRLGKPRWRRRLGRWWSQLRRRWPEVTPETWLGLAADVPQKTQPSTMKYNVWRMGMSHVKVMILRCCVVFALLALVISLASCKKTEKQTPPHAERKTAASAA